jgi:hypothetical protein
VRRWRYGALVVRMGNAPSREIEAAFGSVTQEHAGALLVSADQFLNVDLRDQIIALAAEKDREGGAGRDDRPTRRTQGRWLGLVAAGSRAPRRRAVSAT